MPTEKPAAPEGCVYGPWWDEDLKLWACLAPAPHGAVRIHQWARGTWRFWDGHPAVPELLRLAAQRDRLVEGLERS